MNQTPNPGSPEAKADGCTCPSMDNAHGRGRGNPPQFVMFPDCPLHGDEVLAKLQGHPYGVEDLRS